MAKKDGADLDGILDDFQKQVESASTTDKASWDAANAAYQQHVKFGEDGLPVVTRDDEGAINGFEVGEGAGNAATFAFTGTVLKHYLAVGSSDDQLATLLDLHKDPNNPLARNTLQGWMGQQEGVSFITALQDDDNYLSGEVFGNLQDQLGRNVMSNQQQVLSSQYLMPHKDAIVEAGKNLVSDHGYTTETSFDLGQAIQVYQAASPKANDALYRGLSSQGHIKKK